MPDNSKSSRIVVEKKTSYFHFFLYVIEIPVVLIITDAGTLGNQKLITCLVALFCGKQHRGILIIMSNFKQSAHVCPKYLN